MTPMVPPRRRQKVANISML